MECGPCYLLDLPSSFVTNFHGLRHAQYFYVYHTNLIRLVFNPMQPRESMQALELRLRVTRHGIGTIDDNLNRTSKHVRTITLPGLLHYYIITLFTISLNRLLHFLIFPFP